MKNILILLLFCSSIFESYATHLMGSDISYKYVGPYKYKVTIKIYRDCQGVPLNGLDFNAVCPNGNIKVPLTFNRIAINDISLICSKDSFPCSPANAVSNAGIEEHIYESTIDFTISALSQFKNSGCCEVKITAQQCCRNGSITTITPGNFYSEAMLNVCKSEDYKNNSPEFFSWPIQYLCCNEIMNYANSMIEIDGEDSISFDLVAPLNENNSFESYKSNFTPTKPMTVKTTGNPPGFSFNKTTGSFILTPIKCDEVGIIVIAVTEWRKDNSGVMQKVGMVRREMQLLVKNCGTSNNTPYFSGPSVFSVCEGNKLCFNVTTKDDIFLPNQTIADSTHLSLKSNDSKATFNIKDSNAREKVGEVCWQTKRGDSRPSPYILTFKVEDDHCGDPRFSYREYFVTVKKMPIAKRTYKFLGKGKFVFESIPSDSNFNGYSYSFEVLDSTGNTINPVINSRTDTFTFQTSGKYYVNHIITSTQNCATSYFDTFFVKASDIVSLKTIQLQVLSLSPNPSHGQFNVIGDINFSGRNLSVFSVHGTKVKTIKLKNNQFDLSDLNNGVYMVEIIDDAIIYRTEIVIMH